VQVGQTWYKPLPKQIEFHTNPCRYRLYGGALGGGKTVTLVQEVVAQCLATPGWKALFLRKNNPDLQQIIRDRFLATIGNPDNKVFTFNVQHQTATFFNGSTLRFGHVENETALLDYKTDEYGVIAIDEVTDTLPHYRMWEFLTTRNRSSIKSEWRDPNMVAATNPQGRGVSWCKALFVTKEPPAGMPVRAYKPENYAFIPAKTTDNHHLLENDPFYLENLNAMNEKLKAQLLEGSWDAISGAYFENFHEDKDTYDPKTLEFSPWAYRWISGDWGFTHDAAIHWHVYVSGVTYTYRELIVNNLEPYQLAQRIVELTGDEKIRTVFLGPDAFAKKTSPRTIAIEMNEVFAKSGIPAAVPADNDRKGGARLMHQLLTQGQWKINPRCFNLIKRLPEMVIDPDDPDDYLKVDGDDGVDSARYGIKSVPREIDEPVEEKIRNFVTAKDPTFRALQYQMAQKKYANAAQDRPIDFRGRPRRVA